MTSEWFDGPGGEQVELMESDPLWPLMADKWSKRIHTAISPTVARVEHVGSTSIAGMIAKPVLDLQISVADLEDETAYRAGLESLGLILRQREPDHRFFRPPVGEPRLVHVHVCEIGSGWEQDVLRFRDRVRADPRMAADYTELKMRLVDLFSSDRRAYNAGKAQFISTVIAGE